jgi:hypothetical protein
MSKSRQVNLSDQLRQAIRTCGVSVYRLSQDSGVDRSQLSRFLRGQRDLGLTAAEKICRVLGLRLCAEQTEDGPAANAGQRTAAKSAGKSAGRRPD